MKVHQILINDSGKLPSIFPERTQRCLDSVLHYFGNDRHIYCGEELEQFLSDNFTKEILLSYKKLNSYSIRSDIARMCLLYLYGGLYSDLHLMFRNSLDVNRMNEFSLSGFTPSPYLFRIGYGIHNGLLYCPKPKCKILERAIEYAVHNCKNEYYGQDLTEIAGLLCIGKAYYDCLFKGEECSLNIMGETVNLISDYWPTSLFGFSCPANGLIATFDKPADTRQTGLEGTNFHSELYRSFNMYDTSIKF